MKDRTKLFTRKGRVGEDDDLDDYEQWNLLGDEAKFDASWELVKDAFIIQGKDLDELRFQRSITHIERNRL